MKCNYCIEFYGTSGLNYDDSENKKTQNCNFILGSTNMRASTLDDHEKTNAHKKAQNHATSRSMSVSDKAKSFVDSEVDMPVVEIEVPVTILKVS